MGQEYDKAKPEDWQGAAKILGFDPEHEDKDTLINTIRELGKIRIWPSSPVVQDLLKNLPDDMDVRDVQEFGKGHENNTIIIRSKSKPPLTS